MWAIRNKRTKKWLYGTDYRHSPPTQRTSYDIALLFENSLDAENAFRWRKCGKDYEVIPVRIDAIEKTSEVTE